MTLQQLRYFITLADLEHYTRAAQELMVSQPSLSYAMKELEAELGVALFQKHGRGVALTEAGRVFRQHAGNSLRSLDAGIGAMASFRQNSKTELHVGYLFSVSGKVQPAIAQFLREGSNSDIVIRQSIAHSSAAVARSIINRRADIAFCAGGPQGTRRIALWQQKLIFAAAQDSPLAARGPLTLAALSKEPLVLEGESTHLRQTVLDAFASRGLAPDVSFEAEECNAAAALAASGSGYVVVPESRDFSRDGLAPLAVTDIALSRPIYLVWSEQRESEPMLRFCRYLCRQFGVPFLPETQ